MQMGMLRGYWVKFILMIPSKLMHFLNVSTRGCVSATSHPVLHSGVL